MRHSYDRAILSGSVSQASDSLFWIIISLEASKSQSFSP